jgi:Pyruvate/2-oxoacid:ferredoxin oxidoreductase delta subunit
MPEVQRARRVIEINRQVFGPRPPKLNTVRPRKLDDYPHLPAAYRDMACRLSSPLRMGPPICDELVALVEHLFTEEEAAVARHLGLYQGRTARQLARAEHRPVEELQPVLDRLSEEKRIITRSGPPKPQTMGPQPAGHCEPAGHSERSEESRHAPAPSEPQYRLLPIMPGIFEMMLIGHTPDSLTDWHRRFVELFEALCETGYMLEYHGSLAPGVRYLPVGNVIDAHPMALPSDKLEIVLDQFHAFAVGQCQCRMAMQVLGQGCGKPLGNCMTMGLWAERSVEAGVMRQVSKNEALEIKREAEAHGMVNWMMNVQSTRGQCSCSCCGCCCHALRMVNEFNAPGFIAPPHFLPRLDGSRCTYCGKCAQRCPMGALIVDIENKTHEHLRPRCIGCGLCVVACDRQRAMVMEPVPDYRLPYRSWFSFIAHAAPRSMLRSWQVWRQRRS